MITIKEYYSDTISSGDMKKKTTCKHCNGTYRTVDTLLEIPEDDDYNSDDIIEHCPLCNHLNH
jgi:hypothetical protein